MLASVRTAAIKSATRNVRSFGTDEKLVKTAFYDQHAKLGGKFVPFAGYELPVQYEGLGVLKEHLHTRAPGCASVFDVSHMGQIKWTGKDAVKFIEKMVVGDIAALKVGEAKLSLIMNENGGIVDDTVICNAGDFIYMVVNGACKYKDMDHFKKYMKGMDVHMDYMGDQQLLALQVKTDIHPPLSTHSLPWYLHHHLLKRVHLVPSILVSRVKVLRPLPPNYVHPSISQR